MPLHEATLSNGLRVLVMPLAVHRVALSLFVRVGSRFETPAVNGISHFLEHMLFRGTPSLASSHEQALAFEELGGTLFASTHVDHGLLSVSVPPNNLKGVLPLLAEVVSKPHFSDIEIERGIVREEILEDLDENGRQVEADNLVRALMYADHALGLPITGTLETLGRFSRGMLAEYHARHYAADNARLCVAGCISNPNEVLRLLEYHFNNMPRGRRITSEAPSNGQRKPRFRFIENQSSQTDLRVAFRALCEHDPREPAVEMLLRVLDDGMSTRLYERICDRAGLCYDVSASFETYEDDGVFDIAAGTQHARAHRVLEEVFKIVRDLASHGPSQAELTKALNRHHWSVESMQDDPEATAGFFGLASLANIALTPEARHQELARVTAADVRAAAQVIFRPEKLSVVAVGLLETAEQESMAAAVRRFSLR